MTETPTPAPPAPEPAPPAPAPEPTPPPTAEDEARIPRERLNQEAKKRRDAEQRANDLARQLEEAQNAGLPEVEQLRKRLEAAEKRAEEADRKAQDAERQVQRTTKERWITSAAQAQNFADPSDASAFLNLDEIDDEKDAERAVKRLAGAKKHLVKADDPKLPGRVLQNGQPAQNGQPVDSAEAQRRAEGEMIYEGIKNLTRNWQPGGSL